MIEASKEPRPVAVHCRWMIRADMPRVLAIDAAGFGPDSWDEASLLRCLRDSSRIGVVAESECKAVGWMIYELREDSLGLLRLAVHPRYRRRGVGRQLLAKLLGKLRPHQRTRLEALVPERMLAAQVFLRGCGFRWVETVRDRAAGELYRMTAEGGE